MATYALTTGQTGVTQKQLTAYSPTDLEALDTVTYPTAVAAVAAGGAPERPGSRHPPAPSPPPAGPA